MIMGGMDLQVILPMAVDIAEEASEIAYSYFRKKILIETKQDLSPVTMADKSTEEFIRQKLKNAFPSCGILGEEFGLENGDFEYVWTVDPIDGTRSFIRGIPLFGTLLGLLHKGIPVLGVVVLPAIEETYWAGHQLGAFCNGVAIRVSTIHTLGNAMVGCADISAFRETKRLPMLNHLMEKTELLRGYTDCFGHVMVARGALDAMVDPVVAPWDVVPLACLITEAGGQYSDCNGDPGYQKSFMTFTSGLRKDLFDLIT